MNENIYKIDDYEDFNSYVDNKSYYYYYGYDEKSLKPKKK